MNILDLKIMRLEEKIKNGIGNTGKPISKKRMKKLNEALLELKMQRDGKRN